MCLRTLRQRAIARQKNLCWYGDGPMLLAFLDLPESATAEHLQAVRNGGRNIARDVVAAHQRCNHARHAVFGGIRPTTLRRLITQLWLEGCWPWC